MTAPSWIAMGDELRVELDREHDLAAALCFCILEAEFPTRTDGVHPYRWSPVDQYVALLGKARWERTLETARIYTRSGSAKADTARRYREALAVLRSHGRCLDWPDEPWRTA